IFPMSTLIALTPIPLIIQAGLGLKNNYDNTDLLIPSMSKTLMFSRISGALFVIGLLIGVSF
ncbi:MAG: prenyltransferase, partial [Nitrosopumilaceae archaeon]